MKAHSDFNKEKYDEKHIDYENEKNACKVRHLKKLTVDEVKDEHAFRIENEVTEDRGQCAANIFSPHEWISEYIHMAKYCSNEYSNVFICLKMQRMNIRIYSAGINCANIAEYEYICDKISEYIRIIEYLLHTA